MKLTTLSILLLFLTSAFLVEGQMRKKLEIYNLQAKPIVEAKINGIKAYFLVDTGSDVTIVNKKAAKKFNFGLVEHNDPNLSIAAFGNNPHALLKVSGVKLTFDSNTIRSKVYAFDINNIVRSIYTKTRVKISGIIGSDIMKKYAFNIDYGSKQIWYSYKENKKAEKKLRKEIIVSKVISDLNE